MLTKGFIYDTMIKANNVFFLCVKNYEIMQKRWKF